MLGPEAALAVLCGAVVGFVLGLIGGGGSILATPLLLAVVGLPPHQAIGTGALAVAVNAFANLVSHARAGHVRWRRAGVFALVGALGAALGSTLGKAFDGERLLALFALLMLVVGVLALRDQRAAPAEAQPRPLAHELPRLVATALGVGLLSGFFGIGGGFLIVPGLLFATNLSMIEAVGSSLLSVGSFGLTAAVNYALSGLVAWGVAAEFVAGGVGGGLLGLLVARHLAARRSALRRVFAAIVLVVGVYLLIRAGRAAGWI
ncbi:MAG: sulfite exporter TauE/SafE family protein [Acidibrevibacterium sp.]|uniref:sulfite exporter TauE/SafE family protein n=1 Tax=Acidibrevibacterium fodinaquatile TaxID=1969806 RepID=UPI0023A81400|nr:sulfite exporter TauE/SafE family protein [Acidibrevibacterium fodinaquatile]MCA7119668.1 sulfite exporter TauE/SafE family protein [Acidibrevibacterium fodinaquatile]